MARLAKHTKVNTSHIVIDPRARMDELSLDDHGHWQCPAGGLHDWGADRDGDDAA